MNAFEVWILDAKDTFSVEYTFRKTQPDPLSFTHGQTLMENGRNLCQ